MYFFSPTPTYIVEDPPKVYWNPAIEGG